ncbi:methyltransferase [Candidatus Woesearchaeota archaeon]|nr:methyltransferase [Candidatus Woesearchaeota archaeon]
MYEPAEDSYLLAEEVKKFAFGKVLDVGTGSGIQAITASKLKSVKSVLAVDVNGEAVSFLKNKIKKEIKNKKEKKYLKKIKAIKSDLFSNARGKFDTIIFNPPYLPFDSREPEDSRLATTGGKQGYETLQIFLYDLNNHLTKKGFALILFSSLTNKEKVEGFIEDICFDFEKLSEQKVSFETLYVYKIKRSKVLNELLGSVTNIRKYAEGKRGVIYIGRYKNKKIAIKTKRNEVKTETINKEADILKKINKKRIGPKILFSGNNYFAYEFAEGKHIGEFLEKSSKKEAKNVFLNVLNQCRELDKLKITKEEMTNPYKHVIIGKKITLIDFERAHFDSEPQNVTQFCQYLMRNHNVLNLDKNKLIALAKKYKNVQSGETCEKIRKLVLSS